jgi:hypothetical protein
MTLRELPASTSTPTVQRHGEAIDRLQRSHDELSQRVDALQQKVDRSMMRLLNNLEGLEEKLKAMKTQQLAQQRAAQTTVAQTQQQLDALTTSTRLQQVNAIVGTAQASAFGKPGSVLEFENLMLAGNQLFWMFIDPLLRNFGVIEGMAPSPAAWLSPVGSLLTGQVVVGERQHERLVSGVATFDGSSDTSVQSLRNQIADNLWPEFQQRTDVPVSTNSLDEDVRPTSARVQQGFVRITIASGEGIPSGRVAWVVDTGVGSV